MHDMVGAHRDESGRLRLERYRFGPDLSRSPRNKRLIIKIMDRVFGSTSYTGRLPAYLNSLGCIFSFPTQVENKFWRSDCNDRYIALEQALAAPLDNNPKVEMILTEESSPGALTPGTAGSDYTSRSQLSAQWVRLAAAMSIAFVKTPVCLADELPFGRSRQHGGRAVPERGGRGRARCPSGCAHHGEKVVTGM